MALPALRNWPDGKSWYHEDENGGIYLHKVFVVPNSPVISTTASLALALNDLCCEMKKGMVYVLYHRERPWGVKKKEWSQTSEHAEMPELIYTSEVWSDERQAEWKSIDAVRKLHRIQARCGWVAPDMPVLPFTAQIYEQAPAEPWLQILCRAQVVVMICPLPYVGYFDDLCTVFDPQRGVRFGEANRVGAPAYLVPQQIRRRGWDAQTADFKAKWDLLERWRVDGGRGVLQRLDGMYWDTQHDYLQFYWSLREDMKSLLRKIDATVPGAGEPEKSEEMPSRAVSPQSGPALGADDNDGFMGTATGRSPRKNDL